MKTALAGGVLYFAIVFAVGFMLGTLRVLLLEPRLGSLQATLLEVPLMLLVSWVSCAWTIRRFAVPSARAARLTMGSLAFALLVSAEIALWTLLFGQSVAALVAHWASAAGGLGLASQLVFWLMPVMQR